MNGMYKFATIKIVDISGTEYFDILKSLAADAFLSCRYDSWKREAIITFRQFHSL